MLDHVSVVYEISTAAGISMMPRFVRLDLCALSTSATACARTPLSQSEGLADLGILEATLRAIFRSYTVS
jgi:hypothetical protein